MPDAERLRHGDIAVVGQQQEAAAEQGLDLVLHALMRGAIVHQVEQRLVEKFVGRPETPRLPVGNLKLRPESVEAKEEPAFNVSQCAVYLARLLSVVEPFRGTPNAANAGDNSSTNNALCCH